MNASTAKNEIIHIRVRKEVKDRVEPILQNMGLSTAEAINIYLSQIINTNGIPFAIRAKIPNKETLEAFQETEDIISGKIKRKPTTVDKLFKDMGIKC
jgi:DNA-damage-inducible protein J